MVSEVSSAQRKELSVNFFEDPANYDQISVNSRGQKTLACIDPRDPILPEGSLFKIAIQTGGGEVGEGLDAALALTIAEGRETPKLDVGVVRDKELRRNSLVQKAHGRCAFMGSVDLVLAEMAAPSDFTLDSLDRWRPYLAEPLSKGDIARIGSAATSAREYVASTDCMRTVEEEVKKPDESRAHGNFYEVKGENTSTIYVTNLHPTLGVDRNKKPADPIVAQAIQAYHDGLGASSIEICRIRGVSAIERKARFQASALRSAATRTVLTQDRLAEMTLYEAFPSRGELVIAEQKVI